MVDHLRTTFDRDTVTLLVPDGSVLSGWRVEASSGSPTLTADGHPTPAGRRRGARARRPGAQRRGPARAQRFAAAARVFDGAGSSGGGGRGTGRVDQLRTAILRAVARPAHRSPRSRPRPRACCRTSIDAGGQQEFLSTIDEESDWLNNLVGNLST
jgi:hypothetical protein